MGTEQDAFVFESAEAGTVQDATKGVTAMGGYRE